MRTPVLFFAALLCAAVQGATLVIYQITATTGDGDSFGKNIVAAQRIARDTIKEEGLLLPDFNIRFEVQDVKSDDFQALLKSLEVTGAMDTCDATGEDVMGEVPVVLGCPWSSLSIMSNPALSAFQWSQISSFSTSILLSDTSSYPTFYRTIASDQWQAEGLAHLCDVMEWTRIAVIYVNDNYGIYLTISLLAAAERLKIDTSAIGYTTRQEDTMKTAAQQFAATDAYIGILIVHAWDMPGILEALDDEKRLGYPYFFVGTDAWVDEGSMATYGYGEDVVGFIGTFPLIPIVDNVEDYYDLDGLEEVYTAAKAESDKFVGNWATSYADNASYVFDLEEPNINAYYGYESMMTLANALQILDDAHNLTEYLVGGYDDTTFEEYFKSVIKNNVSYSGLTGSVSFDGNGDRESGMWGYGYITTDRKVETFGIFWEEGGQVDYSVQSEDIVYPEYFDKTDPRSDAEKKGHIAKISQAAFWFMVSMAIVSIFLGVAYAAITLQYRDKKILKAASWRLNMVMIAGCIIAYVTVILYGLDERWYKQKSLSLHFLCNARLWLFILSITIGFSPLFMKTYRISKIFTAADNLKNIQIDDDTLVKYICYLVAVDVLLLTVLTAADPHRRKYPKGRLEKDDKLVWTQHKYGTCWSSEPYYNYIYYSVIVVWKAIEAFWGTYLVSIVCRVGLRQVTKFDETGPILVAIVFGVIVVAALTPVVFIYPVKDSHGVTVRYCVMAVAILVTFNVALGANILPRLCAIYRGREKQYEESPDQKMRRMIQKRLEKMGVGAQSASPGAGSGGDLTKGSKTPQSGNKTPKLETPVENEAAGTELVAVGTSTGGDDDEKGNT